MARQRNNVRLTLADRQSLEKIANSPTTTQHDKLKAQVLLLTDIGEHGPGVPSKNVKLELNISDGSVKRIRHAYAKSSTIEEVFSFSGLGNQQLRKDAKIPKNRTKRVHYIETDNVIEPFLMEHVKCRVTLTREEREKLESILKEGKQTARKFNRAKILLLADEGSEGPALTDEAISDKLDVSMSTVARVRRLFITNGQINDVLNYNHRNAGRPVKIDGVIQATLVAQTCSSPPKGRCKWTLRLLADQLIELEVVDSINHTAVGNALKKMNLNLGSAKNG